jgi:hypothetical protein
MFDTIEFQAMYAGVLHAQAVGNGEIEAPAEDEPEPESPSEMWEEAMQYEADEWAERQWNSEDPSWNTIWAA